MANIPGLYATGIGFAVNTQDTNWEFTRTAGTCTIPSYGYVAADNEVISSWDENNLDLARWLTPAQSAIQWFASPCAYRCRLSFSIPSNYNASTATLTLKFETDDTCTISLNGSTKASGVGGFDSWRTLVISSGFINGTNTLDITVSNDVNNSPTGMRAYFSSSSIEQKIGNMPAQFAGGLTLC